MQCQFITAAAAGVLMVGTPAMADAVGLSFNLVGVNLVDPAEAGGDNYTVDVYLELDAGNRLDAVAGNSSMAKLVAIQHQPSISTPARAPCPPETTMRSGASSPAWSSTPS